MSVFNSMSKPSVLDGIYKAGNGYYKAYYKGVCVAYHAERYYCNEVYILYKTGQVKI